MQRVWAGITAAMGASLMWGTMYVPYRKAYLSGMNPLSFVTAFTVGELGTVLALTLALDGGTHSSAFQLFHMRGVCSGFSSEALSGLSATSFSSLRRSIWALAVGFRCPIQISYGDWPGGRLCLVSWLEPTDPISYW